MFQQLGLQLSGLAAQQQQLDGSVGPQLAALAAATEAQAARVALDTHTHTPRVTISLLHTQLRCASPPFAIVAYNGVCGGEARRCADSS